jgi:hypothetical protein
MQTDTTKNLEVCDGALSITLVLAPMKAQTRVARLQEVPEKSVTLFLYETKWLGGNDNKLGDGKE